MKNGPQLFFALLVASVATVAACAPSDPKSGDNGTGSPTPTPTASPTPTVVPTPTPFPFGINPLASWVGDGGDELWFRYQAGFNGSLQDLSTYATTCSSQKLALGIAGSAGSIHTILITDPKLTNCATNVIHTFNFNFADDDGGCSAGCVTDTENHMVLVSNTFNPGDPVFTNISAKQNDVTGLLQIDALNDPAGLNATVTVTKMRFYDAAGNRIIECLTGVTSAPSTELARMKVCEPVDPLFSLGAGTYKVFFRGTYDNGGDYQQYSSFNYAP